MQIDRLGIDKLWCADRIDVRNQLDIARQLMTPDGTGMKPIRATSAAGRLRRRFEMLQTLERYVCCRRGLGDIAGCDIPRVCTMISSAQAVRGRLDRFCTTMRWI